MANLIADSDQAFMGQLNNFNDKIGGYAATFGLLPGQLASVDADAKYIVFVVQGAIKAKEYSQGWTSRKVRARNGGASPLGPYPIAVDITTPPADVLPDIEKRFRALVTTIKAHPAYNNDIGEDLGIVAANAEEPIIAPTLKVKRDGETVVIGFSKGDNDGVSIYSKRGSEVAFTFLALDTKSPYVDNRPNLVPGTPEKREYYGKLFDDAVEHGDASDTASITL